jgi:DNA polymerase-3 subunit delta
MKLYLNDFEQHLQQGLAPVYIISGDEPLQLGEACDAVRRRARTQGFSEREVMHVEAGFDWNQLLAASQSMSLFAEQRLIELRLPTGRPGDKGGQALRDYCADLPPDTVLMIISGKLDKQSQNNKWFKALDQAGVSLQVWPVEPRQMPGWIRQRMQARGLKPSAEAVTMLVERVEGNLLAAAQEIEKLLLLHGEGPVSLEDVVESVTDSSRFDVFGLVDVLLQGERARAVHMLERLRGEGSEPIQLLWALARELRSLEVMAQQVQQGRRVEQVVDQARVWAKRKAPVTAALKRHSPARWQVMLQRAARIDRIIKGQETGNVWDELLQLCLMITGTQLMRARQLTA